MKYKFKFLKTGTTCPDCQSIALQPVGAFDYVDGIGQQRINCWHCLNSFMAHYKLIGIDSEQDLTKKMEKDYLANKGNQCPFCKSENFDKTEHDLDDDPKEYWQNWFCLSNSCDGDWTDIYKMIDVTRYD